MSRYPMTSASASTWSPLPGSRATSAKGKPRRGNTGVFRPDDRHWGTLIARRHQTASLDDRPGWYSARQAGLTVRRRTAHFGRRLVLAQTFIDDLTQQIVIGPGEIFHLGDELGPDPMRAAEHKRRSETAAARGRHRKRHRGGGKRLQLLP